MDTQKIIDKLNEAFLPHNIECDGASCTGCWKDVIRKAIEMLEEVRKTEDRIQAEFEKIMHQGEKIFDKEKLLSDLVLHGKAQVHLPGMMPETKSQVVYLSPTEDLPLEAVRNGYCHAEIFPIDPKSVYDTPPGMMPVNKESFKTKQNNDTDEQRKS